MAVTTIWVAPSCASFSFVAACGLEQLPGFVDFFSIICVIFFCLITPLDMSGAYSEERVFLGRRADNGNIFRSGAAGAWAGSNLHPGHRPPRECQRLHCNGHSQEPLNRATSVLSPLPVHAACGRGCSSHRVAFDSPPTLSWLSLSFKASKSTRAARADSTAWRKSPGDHIAGTSAPQRLT